MDTAKAIQLLHRLQDEQFDGPHGDERREALDMAVRALSGDGDLISRKMAIEAFEPTHYKDWYTPTIIETLETLPFVRPEVLACGSGELVKESGNLVQDLVKDCISRQQAIDALDEQIENMPSAAPSTAHTTETTAPSTDDWIPVERKLPEDLAEVNVTWVNHEPEPYYEPIKSKPFTASAVYYEGNWYWYSSVCADVLAEYGRNDVDKVDDTIEITAWMPLPEPYGGESDETD